MALRLETFALPDEDPAPATPPQSAVDSAAAEARLSAYDDGYAAGWEDAIAARDDDAARLRDAVGQNLQTIGFAYHEARAHVLQSLRPLLESMTATLLPALARQSLPPLVADALTALATEAADQPVTLRLHPTARPMVESFLTPAPSLPLMVVEDASLSPGQAILGAGPSGARVDLDHAIAEITAALAAFYDLLPAEQRYG